MIGKDELENIRKRKGLDSGQAEKDYLLELALMAISRETSGLIFKGGTCLYKFHGLNRFSEDLDFSGKEDFDHDALFRKVLSGFLDFGVKGHLKEVREPYNSVLAKLKLEGPLFDGGPLTYSSIRIDINKKSEILLQPVSRALHSDYRDILPFQVLCMDEKEIAAEKVRAIVTRDKARDVYDLWFLLKKGIPVDNALLEKKMEYHGLSFDKKKFETRLEAKRAGWKEDLSRLVFGPIPEFEEVKNEILKDIAGI